MIETQIHNLKLYQGDCMDYMRECEDNAFDLAIVDDMQVGKAGEYLVCADLIMQGFIAYPSEQGLSYDVVLDANGKLYKIQVKTTRAYKDAPQRVANYKTYAFNVKRRGKGNKQEHSESSCDIFALVALDSKTIGYMRNEDVKQTMFFRVDKFRGQYRDENINTPVRGKYLSDMKLEGAL